MLSNNKGDYSESETPFAAWAFLWISDVGRKKFPRQFRKISCDNIPENFQYFSVNIIVDNNYNKVS